MKIRPFAALLASALIIGTTISFAAFAAVASAAEKTQSGSTATPIRIDVEEITAGGKISLGSQLLVSETECKVLLTYTGGSKLTVLCATKDGVTKSLPIESGKAAAFQIGTDAEYTISVKNNNAKAIGNVSGMIEFNRSEQTPQAQSSGISSPLNTSSVQAVTYKNVEMRRYEGLDGHPYIHDIKINKTAKKMIGYKYGMLAFDKDGNPLKIDWWNLDTEADSSYFYMNELEAEISPDETYDVRGGWSLNLSGTDLQVEKIAYVLYCDKEITFEDGTVWKNPDFDSWRSTYEGKKTDVGILKSYYPYEQKIIFNN